MTEAQNMPGKPRISIVGAGIAGLSLACRLARVGIPFTIYEARKEQSIGHNYAITLTKGWRKHIGQMFPKEYNESRASRFRNDTACDRLVGGNGQVSYESKVDSRVFQAVDKDVRKYLIKRLVQEKIEVKWEHKLIEVRAAKDGKGALLKFENNHETVSDIIVDSGGLNSSAFGRNISQPAPPKVLPYATYYGTRRISFQEFDQTFADHFRDGNVIKLKPLHEGTEQTPLISVQKIHLQKESDTPGNHTVELRWVFSRPPQGDSDPLWRPKREKEEAKIIPSEFPEAILDLVKTNPYSKKMKIFMSTLFDLSKIENDRVLNWHLRLQLPPQKYFSDNTDRGSYKIFAIGDAAHCLPILESRGAMVAMDDAQALSQTLQRFFNGSDSNYDFHNDSELYDRWVYQAREAVQRLREVHGQEFLTENELDDIVGKPTHTRAKGPYDGSGETSDTSEDEAVGQQSSKI